MQKYKVIVEYITSEIKNGNIKPGKRLPTIRSLSELFNCSKGTVIRAYSELENNHIIYSKPKSGYYLLESKKNTVDRQNSIIDFSAGFPDVNTLPYRDFQHCLNKAIDIYKESLFSYCHPKGLNSLIDVVQKHLEDYQVITNKNNLFITTGSQQAIDILARMPFPNGKKNVLVEQPTYYGAIKSLELNNIPTIGIYRGLNGLDFDELERLFKYNNIKFFIPYLDFIILLAYLFQTEKRR